MATRKKPTPVSAKARQSAAAAAARQASAVVAGQPDASAVMTVVAVEPLRIDGIDVAPDESIEIDAELAADLLERGLVAPVPETPAEPESKPDQPEA